METMKRRLIRVLPVILILALVACAIWAVSAKRQMDAYRTRLENMYERSFYELVDGIGNMEVGISKLLITETPESSLLLLGELWRRASDVQAAFSLLPARDGESTAKFVNQLGDYCHYLSQKVSQGQPITEEEREQLLFLRERLVTLGNHMRDIQAGGGSGDLWAASLDVTAEEGRADPLDDVARPAIDYPTLIYDGPFSDVQEGSLTALPGPWITQEEAVAIARSFVGEGRVEWAQVAQESQGDIPAFRVEMMLSRDGVVNLQVTRQGGHILWMMPERAPWAMYYDLNACLEEAKRFAAQAGYPQAELSYYQAYDGVAVFNLIPVQEGVWLYPDLYKIQVSMETCQVVGVEARHFLLYHKARVLPEVTFSQEEALLLATRLEVSTARLCLIPKLEKEILCHEITGTFLGENYILYIDAQTGKEVDLFKVIDVEGGQLAM